MSLGAYTEKKIQQERSKLMVWEDESFQVLERINNNTYKIDLSGKYDVSITFNVSNLSLFDVDEDS